MFALYHHSECFVEHLFETNLRQCTTLHVFALQLLIDNSLSVLACDWSIFCVVLGIGRPQINFVADEDLRNIRYMLLEFCVPLN
jgi:hypothetical protein